MHKKRITPKIRQQIRGLRYNALSVVEIAEQVGFSERTIRKVLKTEGVAKIRVISPHSRLHHQRIIKLAQEGLSVAQVAKALRTTAHSIKNASTRHDLRGEAELILVGELAQQLGLTKSALKRTVEHGHLQASHWFTAMAFTVEQVEQAQQFYSQYTPLEEIDDWLSSEQAARELGISASLFLRRRQSFPEYQAIQQRRAAGVSGRCYRYDRRGVIALKAKAHLPKTGSELKKQGYLSAKMLTAALGVSQSGVSGWATHGAPHERDKFGYLWFKPVALLAWLEQGKHHRKQANARKLREYLQQEQQSAA